MKTNEKATCSICGEPMPEGEEMFNYHGYSGPCPKPPLKHDTKTEKNDYTPFGDEWRKEMAKFSKPELIELLRDEMMAVQHDVSGSLPNNIEAERQQDDDIFAFAMYLTGHDEETIQQIYRDWH